MLGQVLISLAFLHIIQSQKQLKTKKDLETEDDGRFLKESVAKFGPPQPRHLYGLPGPEIDVKGHRSLKQDSFHHNLNNFTHRYRSKSRYFSYNGRYEVTYTKVVDSKEIIVIKGQVSEEIVRKFGGRYVRTIGYVFDETGFRTFLIDVSIVVPPKSTTITPRFGLNLDSMVSSRSGFLTSSSVPVLPKTSD